MTKVKPKRKKILKWLLGISLVLITGLIGFYFSVYWGFWEPLATKEQLSDIRQSEATEIFAADGELLGKYFIFDRQPIDFEEIPKHLIDALVATEDARFYEHNGVDRRSLLRVIFKTILLRNESSGGGSTISQQLIKNLYPRQDHGIFSMPVSKTRESILAVRLEKIYSKEEVITLYLNTVPFGDNTFGIESAAEKFFSKTAQELTLEESAVIVGMLKASHSYNPRLFPERSKLRRNVVMNQMKKYGYLTEEQYQIASNTPLELSYTPYSHNQGTAAYFRANLRKKVQSWLKDYNDSVGTNYNLYTSGLKVYTTLDYGMQKLAEESLTEHLTQLQSDFEQSYGQQAPWYRNKDILKDAVYKSNVYKKLKDKGLSEKAIQDSLSVKHNIELWDWAGKKLVKASALDSIRHYTKFLNAGVLSVDPFAGEIKAWIGGIDYEHFQYDHVSQSKRQVGSTFKPVVYATALEQGIEPCKFYSARQVTYTNYNNWTPVNSGTPDYDKRYAMKSALANSVNTVAVKVMEDGGIENVIDLAERMGIESEIPQVPSIALGTASISIMELAKAYTSFLNMGKPSTPYFIKRIENSNGEVLAEFQPKVAEEPVFSESTRLAMLEMMKGVVNEGTATRLRWKYGLKNDIAGKTGTTQDNKDGWFVGITPRLLTISWVGADDYRIGFRTTAMGQGANSALPIFGLLQQKMIAQGGFERYTDAQFPPPSIAIQNMMSCATEKKTGVLNRVFVNNSKPKVTEFDYTPETAEPKKKEGILKKIGNIFKRKDKKKKKKRGS
ncbi:transglycosylase domain-containing protein [Roseivirga misakiensis]|uniref:Penicillin-binding protein n=1 Tax=Roseivirga misakiensis TaxID=1563681 RepID=A0A1E5SY72_9BACT|nr:transglycosylase domain-containing protein [Roseivirga misakiensis]OEK04084.1 penicillin-binding protein [Roseivirga misakiensis]